MNYSPVDRQSCRLVKSKPHANPGYTLWVNLPLTVYSQTKRNPPVSRLPARKSYPIVKRKLVAQRFACSTERERIALLDRHRFGQVSGLVDIFAQVIRDEIRHQL